MRKTVYIETTIPSFYYEVRPEPDMVARRDWTRQWWDHRSGGYGLLTSQAVLDELGAGGHPHKEDAIALLESVPLVAIEKEMREVVQVYIARRLMPRDPAGDALHLAVASSHECDFLLTWNCSHLANANKFEHIHRVNDMLGLFTPALVTPLQLLGEEGPDEG